MSRFAIFPSTVFDDRRLTGPLICLLALISTYADRDGWCWPSQERLAKQLGAGLRTVNRNIADLIKLGYLTTQRRRGSSLMRLVYDLPEMRQKPDIRHAKYGASDTPNMAHRTATLNDPTELLEKRSRARRLPADWKLTPEQAAWAKLNHPTVDAQVEAAAFIAHWSNLDTPNSRKLNWDQAFRTWITNEEKYAAARSRGRTRPSANGGTETTEQRRRKLVDALGPEME